MTDHKVSRTGDGLVFKEYRPNAGDVADREWRALSLLWEYAPGLAPQPVAADLDADPPSITMSALPGESLGGSPLSAEQMNGIAAALDRLHTCVPRHVLAEIPSCPRGDAGKLIRKLEALPRPCDDAVTAQAYDESLRWLAATKAGGAADELPDRPVLGRADHNLSNFLWDGHDTRLIDFEYAGWSEVYDEMAELVEHISARCTPDHLWRNFLDRLPMSPAERARLLTARRGLVIMWFSMLFPGQGADVRNPPGTLRKQAVRTLELLNA